MCLKPALVVKSSLRYSHAWWSQRLSNDVRWVWKSETRINKYIVITVSKPQTEILDRQQLPVIGSSKKSFVRNNSSKSPHFYRNWRIQYEHLMTDIVIFHSSYLDDCWYHPWTFCIVGIGLNCSIECPSGWQKLHGSTGGTRRKVWTQTKILSPNIRYFVVN